VHDNRFVEFNTNCLISSKNRRASSIDFNKQVARKANIFAISTKEEPPVLTPEEKTAMKQKINYPFSFRNQLPKDYKGFLRRRKKHYMDFIHSNSFPKTVNTAGQIKRKTCVGCE
jgi:hypothetical protein